MNEKQIEKSEKVASNILRALAIIGLVAVLVLATWTVVQGTRFLPNFGGNMSAAVSAVRSVFTTAPSESLVFELEDRTLIVNEPTQISWTYTGENEPSSYSFMYECGTSVSLRVKEEFVWNELLCDTKQTIDGKEISITPINNETRFADITLVVDAGELRDSTVITVMNADIESIHASTTTTPDATTAQPDTTKDDEKEVVKTTTTATTPTPTTTTAPTTTKVPTTPKATTPVQAPVTQPVVVPLYSGPADLVIEIAQTGVLMEVAGEDTFFPISPIPDNKVGAVTFTVTNRGGLDSGTWFFKANLPVEGDSNYLYTSPLQTSLSSGMQVEYTLGFDEVLKNNKGTIEIEIFPTNSSDKKTNNTDSVQITIDER